MATATSEVLVPTSPDEAVKAFGDGSGVTVVGGGTILMPELTYGRLRPSRVLLLARSGLDGISSDGGTARIGAATTLQTLAESAPEPLRSAAQRVGDYEIRGHATLGGNLCATSTEVPRGDLQAPLIVLAANVRSAGSGGERIDSVEDFLAGAGAGRLVLEVELAEPEQAAYASLGRPHAHAYTILSVAAAAFAGGTVRVAAGGVAATAKRLPTVEAALAGGLDHAAAAEKALDDVDPPTDPLASTWYRKRMLPTLVARALAEL